MHALAGDLPLPVVHLLSSMKRIYILKIVDLANAGRGFTLPANMGELDPAITELDLRGCNLTGALC